MNSLAYTDNDIIKAFVDVGLQKGDTVYLSTSLGMIGKAKGVNNAEDLNILFFEAIKRVLGKEGTILVPTYSYTFGNTNRRKPKIFDPSTTPAEVGPFPIFFMKQKGVVRSLDPMKSVAGLGPSAEILFKNLPLTSYGKDSLYARLINHPNTKCVSVGLGPNWVPFLHHADWLAHVPFRYDKLFFGGIRKPTGIEYIHWLYSVRVLMDETRADAHELGNKAVDMGIWGYTPLGRARVYACNYKDFFDFTMRLLKKNKWLTAKGPACNVLKRNLEAMEKRADLDAFNKFGEQLYRLPRDVMGDGINIILAYIKREHPIDVHKFKTGANVFDWIVPEKQSCTKEFSYVAKLQIGEWFLKGTMTHSLLICCYLDAQTDYTLSGLAIALKVMKRLQKNKKRQFTYRLAIMPGTVGYAAYLTTLSQEKILGALHLIRMDTPQSKLTMQRSSVGDKQLERSVSMLMSKHNYPCLPPKTIFDPLSCGHNPVAGHALTELAFDNIIIAKTNDLGTPYAMDRIVPEVSVNYLYRVLNQCEKDITPR